MYTDLTGNGFGVGDAGSAGLEVSDCTITRNSYEGVTVNPRFRARPRNGRAGRAAAENIIEGNGRHGIWLDYTDEEETPQAARHRCRPARPEGPDTAARRLRDRGPDIVSTES
ncbi:MAG: hypothetical protein ACXV3F_08800 [Frankiaceae bacterium]